MKMVEKYIAVFERSGISAIQHDETTLATDQLMQLQHCYWMLLNHCDKERWLGFVEGVLWSQSVCTIEELIGGINGTTKI